MTKLSLRASVLVVALTVPWVAALAETPSDAEAAALAYLKALSGQGDESNRELLLGGATMNAQLFNLENYQIVSKDPVQREHGDLAKASELMRDLDHAGHQALTGLMNSPADADGLSMTTVSQEDAQKLMAPTREKAAKFTKQYPVLAYVARVGKEVYWHPKNPLRAVMAEAGRKGSYTLELNLWYVVTKEGPRQTPRRWPLRVLRFQSDKLDTGYKVLPASDWNAE